MRALRKGWIKRSSERGLPRKEPEAYLLWADDGMATDRTATGLSYVPAPKTKLPGHEESYNPPKEYLPSEVCYAPSAPSQAPGCGSLCFVVAAYLGLVFTNLQLLAMSADVADAGAAKHVSVLQCTVCQQQSGRHVCIQLTLMHTDGCQLSLPADMITPASANNMICTDLRQALTNAELMCAGRKECAGAAGR